MDPRTWALLPPDAKVKIIEQNAQSGLQIQQQGAEEKQKDLLEAQQKAPTAISQMQQMDKTVVDLQNMKNLTGPLSCRALLKVGVIGSAKRSAADILIKAAADDKEHPGAFSSMWNAAQTSVLSRRKGPSFNRSSCSRGRFTVRSSSMLDRGELERRSTAFNLASIRSPISTSQSTPT